MNPSPSDLHEAGRSRAARRAEQGKAAPDRALQKVNDSLIHRNHCVVGDLGEPRINGLFYCRLPGCPDLYTPLASFPELRNHEMKPLARKSQDTELSEILETKFTPAQTSGKKNANNPTTTIHDTLSATSCAKRVGNPGELWKRLDEPQQEIGELQQRIDDPGEAQADLGQLPIELGQAQCNDSVAAFAGSRGGSRPYFCRFAGCTLSSKPFKFLSKLKDHERSHEAQVDPCPKCGQLLEESRILKKHMYRIHKVGGANQSRCAAGDPHGTILDVTYDDPDMTAQMHALHMCPYQGQTYQPQSASLGHVEGVFVDPPVFVTSRLVGIYPKITEYPGLSYPHPEGVSGEDPGNAPQDGTIGGQYVVAGLDLFSEV